MEKRTADQEFAQMIVERLEAWTTPWQREWNVNEALCRPFHNVVSDKPYKGANVVRLWIASDKYGYTDPRFITYKQAAEHGWQVKKGSKGTYISFFKPVIKEQENDEGETEQLSYFAHRGYTVFNAQQIEGIEPLPEPERFEWDPVELGEAILANSGAKITHSEGADGCSYRPALDDIVLPSKSLFKSAAGYYSAAIHELAHWTGADHRLARKLTTDHGREDYAREELRAEIASWMISTATGLPFSPDNHAAYVAGWIKAIKNDFREIFRACADAERIKEYILAFVPADEKKAA